MKIEKRTVIRLMILLIVAFIYPYYRFRNTNNFIEFVDSLTIEGLVLLAMGLTKRLFNNGAFSAISYNVQRKFFNYSKSYAAYMKDNKSMITFNYPLWLGIISLLLSLILSFIN